MFCGFLIRKLLVWFHSITDSGSQLNIPLKYFYQIKGPWSWRLRALAGTFSSKVLQGLKFTKSCNFTKTAAGYLCPNCMKFYF